MSEIKKPYDSSSELNANKPRVSQQPEQESSKQESPYNKKELKWLEEQKVEYFRLKKMWDVPEGTKETEEIIEARRKSLEIAKAVKELKMEREPEKYNLKVKEYIIEVPPDAVINKAIDINGRLFMNYSREDKVFLSDGRDLNMSFDNPFIGPFEYDGKMILMKDGPKIQGGVRKMVIGEEGDVIQTNLPEDIQGLIVVNGKIIYTSDDSVYEVEEGKLDLICFAHGKIKEVVGDDNGCMIVEKGNSGEWIANEDNQPLTVAFKEVKSPVFYKDQIAFLAKGYNNNWYIVLGDGEESLPLLSSDVDCMISFGDKLVYSGLDAHGNWMVMDDKANAVLPDKFDKIFEIGKVTESMGYVLGQKDDKLIKSTFKIEKNE